MIQNRITSKGIYAQSLANEGHEEKYRLSVKNRSTTEKI